MYDTIIIGAGMSGLAAGIRLAYFDQRVCILERHTTVGGLNSFYRQRGRNYDVGLHAVTNVCDPTRNKRAPLSRLLRQLRFTWDDFAISPQIGSRIAFPDMSLSFNNNLDLLRSEIQAKFPREVDNFERLLAEITDYDDVNLLDRQPSARRVVGAILGDPLLIEMLFCPLMFYGSASEHDMDFAQFSIMFRSIFLEGLGRPRAGVRLILKNLVRRFRSLGGELKLRSGVRHLGVRDDQVEQVELDDGQTLQARRVLSSAGWLETMRLCDRAEETSSHRPGQLSFCETIATLDVPPADLRHRDTIVFFNDSPHFHWEKPDVPCDLRSGVICSPNNFEYPRPLSEGTLRITVLANYDRWKSMGEETYRLEKLRWYDKMATSAVRFVPDYRGHVIDTDMFTPTTIVRYTGHCNGAIYGSPDKQRDGTTHLKNLFVCGTDQGWVGIIGSLMSGISIANQHLLRES
ncbi:MAG: phytoene desaturase family protein [Pirellulales bacterium]